MPIIYIWNLDLGISDLIGAILVIFIYIKLGNAPPVFILPYILAI